MTYAEISQMISAVGIPYAYHHFEEGSGQQPPFITFYYQGDNDLVADNINYAAIRPLTIELYTDNKDFALEAAVESVLTANDLAFSRTETFIDSEQMYMVTYYTEVIINA
jgi:hypothetical protein